MAERADPFDDLRRPLTPIAPRPEFAASLRRWMMEELGMTITDVRERREPRKGDHGGLGMVHLGVGDADRAMRFFGALFGWEGERVDFGDHISHYVSNTAVTVRILDDPAAAPVRPGYTVDDVAAALQAIHAGGGEVSDSQTSDDGGGHGFGADDQGVPLLVYRYGGRYEESSAPVSGDVGLIFITADLDRARRFYGPLLGWALNREDQTSWYVDAVPMVGLFDAAAAFGGPATPSARFYVSVPALAPVLSRIERLGGHPGPAAQDMGPFYTALCTDDQGTEFGVMSRSMD